MVKLKQWSIVSSLRRCPISPQASPSNSRRHLTVGMKPSSTDVRGYHLTPPLLTEVKLLRGGGPEQEPLPPKSGRVCPRMIKAQKLAREFWLEAIDPWHRNGCNLHVYYVEWLHSRSEQPFFHWLEIGEGKDVDLLKCPRALLEKQRIKYLAPSEREAYEVTVKERKLIQKQTGEPLNTTGDGPARVLYVGLKKKGEFHHSSFLAGAAIIASGRLVVHSGTLMAVWPVSSSYQHMERNFRKFISFSKEKNLDLTKTVSEWVFLFVGLVLEILLVAMDQCATPSKPHYSLVAVVASFATILTCLMELSYKARKEGFKI